MELLSWIIRCLWPRYFLAPEDSFSIFFSEAVSVFLNLILVASRCSLLVSILATKIELSVSIRILYKLYMFSCSAVFLPWSKSVWPIFSYGVCGLLYCLVRHCYHCFSVIDTQNRDNWGCSPISIDSCWLIIVGVICNILLKNLST